MMQDSDTSVIVSWDIIDVTGVVVEGYTVYYSRVSSRKRQAGGGAEMSVDVFSTESSVRITGLEAGQQYQFQVVVRIMFRGQSFTGSRIELNDNTAVPVTTSLQQTTCPNCRGKPSSHYQFTISYAIMLAR